MITVYALAAFRPELKGLIRDIRPVWALEELGIAYTRKVMDATKQEHKQPEYLAINPFGKVPAIQDGEFCLFESAAICTYLGDKVGKLLPQAGTRSRALYNQWVSYVTSTLEPLATRVIWLDWFTEKNESTERLRREMLTSLEGMAKTLDSQLAERPFLMGESFSLADIQLASVWKIAGHTEIAAKHPNLNAYLQKCYLRPAFQRALLNNG